MKPLNFDSEMQQWPRTLYKKVSTYYVCEKHEIFFYTYLEIHQFVNLNVVHSFAHFRNGNALPLKELQTLETKNILNKLN